MNLSNIRAIVLDVDGVLTDGRLYFTDQGECMKVFHVHDGTAIKHWGEQGGKIALLSGRRSGAVEARARELGIEQVIQGISDKRSPFYRLLKVWGLSAEQVCFVGDDAPDLPLMEACGFAVAVANAVPAVRSRADYVTNKAGGAGAVREVVDHLLSHREAS